MAKIISFSWTSPALVARAKSCTRRDWNERYALSFREGELVQAWDRSPRVKGSRQIAWIRLTQDPSWEHMSSMPDSDYEAEGFKYFSEHPNLRGRNGVPLASSLPGFLAWRIGGGSMWVVRFKLEEILGGAYGPPNLRTDDQPTNGGAQR